MFGSPLTIPGDFLEGDEFPPSRLLQQIEQAVFGFAVPPPHHVSTAPPAPLPPALLAAKFVFVREDASIPPLAPLYHGPYLVLERLGDRMDVLSADRLKPAFSDEPISPALPSVWRRPALNQVQAPHQLPPPLPAVVQVPVHRKKVSFVILLRFLLGEILTVQLEKEGSTPPLLHCSFWGE